MILSEVKTVPTVAELISLGIKYYKGSFIIVMSDLLPRTLL